MTRCDSNCATSIRIGEAIRCQTIHNDGYSCSSCNRDPIKTTKELLENSYLTALKKIHLDKFKNIIEREWGSTIDRTTELAVKTIEKQWQAPISSSIANKELYEELGKIITSNRKQ